MALTADPTRRPSDHDRRGVHGFLKSDRHINDLLTLLVDRVHGERPFFGAGHAGRTGRHAGKRKPPEEWMLGQQFLYRFDRHVTVDNIVAEESRVASLKVGRNTRLGADRSEVLRFPDRHLETVFAKRGGVPIAAFTAGAL